jgi:hypothetical protein
MPDFFPQIAAIKVNDVTPGSIVEMRRSGSRVFALATDHIENNSRSLVILNGTFSQKPSVVFLNNWRNIEDVLVYNAGVRFEVSMNDRDFDPNGNRFGEIFGALVLVGDQLCIRAARFDTWNSPILINAKTGSVFSDPQPYDVWHFSSWRLWVRDLAKDCSFELFHFSLNK